MGQTISRRSGRGNARGYAPRLGFASVGGGGYPSGPNGLQERPLSTPDDAKSLPDQVFDAVVRLFWASRKASMGLQREFGVTAPQLSALRILERRGDLSQSELSRQLLVSGSTLSGLLDRLQSRRLVKRVRNRKDRRQVRVHLTDAGRALLATIPRGRSKFGALRQVVRDLPEEQAAQLLTTLSTMAEVLSREPAPEEA